MVANKNEALLQQKIEEAEKAAKIAREAALKADRLAQEVLKLKTEIESGTTVSVSSTDEPPVKTKTEDDSSSSSDSSDDDEVKKEPKKTEVTPVKKQEKKADSDSDDSSDEEDAKVDVNKAKDEKEDKDSSDDDSSDDDSDDDADPVAQVKKDAAATAKKEEDDADDDDDDSSSDDSSESSDDDDDDEADAKMTKEPVKTKVEKVTPEKYTKRKETDSFSQPPHKKAAVGSEEPTKIYVRGLPWKAQQYEVQEFFATCGEISNVEMPLQDDGRSSGTAILTFADKDGAEAAIQLNGKDFQGRWLSIKYSTPKPIMAAQREPSKKEQGCCTVFVGNMSWDIDEDALRQAFASCGEIVSVRFATDRETGDFKGFGHIEFAETEATDKAVAMAGTDILGRAVRVDFANERRPDRQNPGSGGGRGGGGGGGGRDYMNRGGGGRSGGRGGGGRGGGRGGGGGFAAKKHGAIAAFAGKKITFD